MPIKHLSNFCRTLEKSLIIFKVNLKSAWSTNYVITNSTGPERFKITSRKLYVPGVTLLIQDNTKLLEQLKLGLKRIIKWDKYSADFINFNKNCEVFEDLTD